MLAAKRRRAGAESALQQSGQSATGTNRQEWRRFDLRSALVTTALGTGVLAAAGLWPASGAMAGCVDVTTDPNSVFCDDFQTTTDTTDPTTALGDGFSLSDRNYLFTADGDIEVEITVDGEIEGNGLAVTTTEFGSAIIVEHHGAISVDAGNSPSEGGTGVFNLTTDGGDITYTGTGSVIDNDGGNPGLVIDTGAGAGDINVSAVPDYEGERAALWTMSGTGNQNILLDGGQLVSTGFVGAGVFATSSTGNINVELTGNTQITTTVASPNEVWGVEASSTSGAITISSDADMGRQGSSSTEG